MILHLGNNKEVLKNFESNSIDSIVTDPPYEIGFMSRSWDSSGIAYDVELWSELLRVLKPGGHLLAFSGTRTYHRMAVAIEDAGFEIRDMIEWVYGSGFPKSLNIGKAVDKLQRGNKTVELINALLEEGKTLKEIGEMAGIPSLESSYRDWTTGGHKPEERSWERMLKGLGFSEKYGLNIIEKRTVKLGGGNSYTFREGESRDWEMKITKGTSQYEGWGTALKPAHEPICMARKPLEQKTVAENCLKWGTGGINIDESRVGSEDLSKEWNREWNQDETFGNGKRASKGKTVIGRFPANLIHDGSEEVMACFPETKSGGKKITDKANKDGLFGYGGQVENNLDASEGNASRFFKSIIYTSKPSKAERNKGCEPVFNLFEQSEGLEEKKADTRSDIAAGMYKDKNAPHRNSHPTVKPIELMEYLIKMITPKGGIVLDPFMGSGSTGCGAVKNGFDFIGIDMTPEYLEIAEKRIKRYKQL